jgi:DNA modification methylase
MSRVTLINADVLAGLALIPDESVHCVVTSPPYWGLRDYGIEGQIGFEPTIEKFVGKMVEVFREVRRVLRSDGVLFLNLGDTYAASRSYQVVDNKYKDVGNKIGRKVPDGLKPKDLCGLPWRVALALQADGWYLRSDIIWAKPNPMPESCTDRPTTAHEHIFLLTKSAKYFYDAEAVREEGCGYGKSERFRDDKYTNNASFDNSKKREDSQGGGKSSHDGSGRNLRNVWTIATAPFPQAHFATFPPAIPERCIKAGTSERGCCPKCGAPWKRVVEKKACTMNIRVRDTKKGIMQYKTPGHGATESEIAAYGKEEMGKTTTIGWEATCKCGLDITNAFYDPIPCTVLDPFSGAGTTALVAAKLGRDAVGIELNPEYVEMSRKRIVGELGMLVTFT